MDTSTRANLAADAADPRSAATSPITEAPPDYTPDPVERGYNAVHTALAAKPTILDAILDKTQCQSARDFASSLQTGKPYRPGDAQRLALAEKQYQKSLEENADQVFEQFKHLPIDRKIELLIEAEEIGERNDKARAQAREQMQTSHEKALAAHKAAEKASEPATPVQPKKTEPVAAQAPSPWNGTLYPGIQPDITLHLLQAPSTCLLADFSWKNSATPPTDAQKKHLLPLSDNLGIGSPAAVTVNLPFTSIPFMPAVNKVLQKVDRIAHLDLGFTLKGVADRVPNQDGGYDELYRLNYVGGGIMSSKFNIQFAPIALDLVNKVDETGWGASSSIFARRRNDLIGEKVSVSESNNSVGVSFAAEANYAAPSSRLISNLTGGRYFGADGPSIRVPGAYVGTLNRIIDALPTKEEMGVIYDQLGKVIPVEQALEVAMDTGEFIAEKTGIDKSIMAVVKHLFEQDANASGLTPEQQAIVMARLQDNLARSNTQDIQSALKIHDHHPWQAPDHSYSDNGLSCTR